MKHPLTVLLILLVAGYLILWGLTATLGVWQVEKECTRLYVNLTSRSTYAPCPFLVCIYFEYDHSFGAGSAEARYAWLLGYLHRIHLRPLVHASKL